MQRAAKPQASIDRFEPTAPTWLRPVVVSASRAVLQRPLATLAAITMAKADCENWMSRDSRARDLKNQVMPDISVTPLLEVPSVVREELGLGWSLLRGR